MSAPPPGAAAPPVVLQPLGGAPADVALLQALLEAAPGYARLTSGADPAPDAAASTLAALPPGCSAADKFVFAVCVAGEAVGCVDLIRGYPAADTAMLGLLLLAERHQGRGLGRAAYAAVEAHVRRWPEVARVRIGVVDTNARVLPFWHALGFAENGEPRPYANGRVHSRVRVLERRLPPLAA